MMNVDTHKAILHLYPETDSIVEDVAYDKKGKVIKVDYKKVSDHVKSTEYQRLRAAEYPDFAQYLDGVVKGDQQQIQAYIDACLAVKAKYPKPEGV